VGELLIKNIDNELLEQIKQNAELHGVSLEEEAKFLLDQAIDRKKGDREEIVKWANDFRKKVGPQKSDSVDLIREDRDGR